MEAQRFGRYLNLLSQWNKTYHLTAFRSSVGIVDGLFLDSLLFLSQIPVGRVRVADLGTGAGIPGIPMRIARDDISLTLVESRRKCVSFLAALKRDLEMDDVVVLEGRAEELVEQDGNLGEAFDVVVVRAVGAAVIPIAMRYLRPGGLFVAGGSPGHVGSATDQLAKLVTAKTMHFDRLKVERTFLIAHKAA